MKKTSVLLSLFILLIYSAVADASLSYFTGEWTMSNGIDNSLTVEVRQEANRWYSFQGVSYPTYEVKVTGGVGHMDRMDRAAFFEKEGREYFSMYEEEDPRNIYTTGFGGPVFKARNQLIVLNRWSDDRTILMTLTRKEQIPYSAK